MARYCEDCGVKLSQKNHGGWVDSGGNRFHAPRREYRCDDCFDAFEEEEREQKEAEAKATAVLVALVVGGAIGVLVLIASLRS